MLVMASRCRRARRSAASSFATTFKTRGRFFVGGKQHFERRAVADLCDEVPGRAERGTNGVPGVFFKGRDQAGQHGLQVRGGGNREEGHDEVHD